MKVQRKTLLLISLLIFSILQTFAQNSLKINSKMTLDQARKMIWSKKVESQIMAVYTLGNLGDKQSTDKIARLLDSDLSKLRQISIWALGKLKSKKFIDKIKQMCNDHDLGVQTMGLKVLCDLAGPTAIPVLLKKLTKNNQIINNKIKMLLLKFSPQQILPLLKNYLKHPQTFVRINAINVLIGIDSKQSLEYLAKMLNDKSFLVVKAAGNAIAGQKEKAEKYIIKTLTSNNVKAKLCILKGIEGYKNKNLIKYIIPLTASIIPKIRKQVVILLGIWKVKNSISILEKMLNDPHELVRAEAIWSLSKFKKISIVKFLKKMLFDKSWKVRCAAINILGNLDTKNNKQCSLISKFLKDSHWSVRYSAVKQLEKLNCSQNLSNLYKMLKDPHETVLVKKAICHALGRFHKKESIKYLLDALQSKSTKISGSAELALTRVMPHHFYEFLKLFKNRNVPTEIRKTIGLIFGRIKATNSRLILYDVLKNENEEEVIRYIALILLADFEKENASDIFISFLDHKSLLLKKAAILCLGKIKNDQKTKKIFAFLNSKEAAMREAAAWTISRLDLKKTRPFIFKLLGSTEKGKFNAGIRLIVKLKIIEAIPLLIKKIEKNIHIKSCYWAIKELESFVSKKASFYPQFLKYFKKSKKILQN